MIELDEVSKAYDGRLALDSVTLSLGPGVLGLIGANGAGKTTLLKVIDGRLRPTSGAVRVAECRVGYMPQEFVAPSSMRVDDFMHYAGWLQGMSRSCRTAEIQRCLDMTNLSAHKKRKLSSLSGGQLRRALFAQAMLSSPEVLLLDEPTTGLDPVHRIEMRRHIHAASDGARTIILSSHIMEDIVGLADRVCLLDDGHVMFVGSTDELKAIGEPYVGREAALSPYEAAFLAIKSGRR